MTTIRARQLVIAVTLLSWLPLGRTMVTRAARAPIGALQRGTPARDGASPGAQAPATELPNKVGSLKFAAFGDFGSGGSEQYQTAEQLIKTHQTFPFDVVALLGDNLYGSERPQDFQKKFEIPYKLLLDSGVQFYASLGNHDDPQAQRNYKLFNMNGKRYFSFKAPRQNVRFFALESTYMDPDQVKWIQNELQSTTDAWKIVYFHHPLYSSGRTHGSDLALRATLEPMFVKYGVSLVMSGHDHIYERIKPQKGIPYFVVGSGGELRRGDLHRSALTAAGFDTDNVFLTAEIIDETLYFNAVTRTGLIVDSGVITRQTAGRGTTP